MAAGNLGFSPVLTVATNSSGAVVAKMVSPQSIAVATASVGLVGKEGELFRRLFGYSIGLGILIGLISLLQAHSFKWMIPAFKAAEKVGTNTVVSMAPGLSIIAVVLLLVAVIWAINRRIAVVAGVYPNTQKAEESA